MRFFRLLCTLALAATACSSETSGPAAPDLAPAPCVTNDQCATAMTGHVCSSGACVVCASNADCASGKKCQNQMACVDCLQAGDCMAGQKCVGNTCTTGCDDKNPCPAGQVCDLSTSGCVQCVTDADCSGGTPHCDTGTHLCVGCTKDDDCGTGQVCHAAMCVTGCSGAHPACPTAQVCNLSIGACVDCLGDGDCKDANASRCDVRSNTCVECLPSGDNCPTGAYCAGTMCTPGCKASSDCTGAPADGGTDDGGVLVGVQCDTRSHVCAQCVDDSACPAGQVCMNDACVAGCNGQHACPAGQGCCGGACFDIQSDVANCGACGNACAQGMGCCAGGCVSLSSVNNCGTCGNACATGSGCCDGACTPLNTATDCGTCGNACQQGAGCCGGTCTPITTAANCGGCGIVCGKNEDCCDGGCASLLTTSNCGTCGTVCTASNGVPACIGLVCTVQACNPGFFDCNRNASDGCEVDALNDPSNCGGCGVVCPTGIGCANGVCNAFPSSGIDGAFAPTRSTTLPAGTHNFTTISIPAGVTITIAAAGNTGVLDLRATGDIVVDGVIDVSGGPGAGTASAQDGCFGGTTAIPTAGCNIASFGGCVACNGTQASQPGGSGGNFTGAAAGANATGGTVNGLGGTDGGGSGGIAGGGGGGYAGGAGGGGGATLSGGKGGRPFGGTPRGADCGGNGGNGGGAPYNGGRGGDGVACGGCGSDDAGGGGGSIGQDAAQDLAMATTFRPGSAGGGGGGSANTGDIGAGGGGAGGAIRLASPTRVVLGATSALRANGGQGGTNDGGGGGGSGGAIYVAAPVVAIASGSSLSAIGGAPGAGDDVGSSGSPTGTCGGGGYGGLGRIRFSLTPGTSSLQGSFNPPLENGVQPANASGFSYVGVWPN